MIITPFAFDYCGIFIEDNDLVCIHKSKKWQSQSHKKILEKSILMPLFPAAH